MSLKEGYGVKKEYNKIIKVSKIALDYVSTLTEGEMDKLIDGKNVFTIKEKSMIISEKLEEERFDWINEIETLKKYNTTNDAVNYLGSLKLTKIKLVSLGQALNIKISKGITKDRMINIIVNKAVGEKLKIEGLRKGIIKNN